MTTINPGVCKGCGAKILWIKNRAGKPEPFDAQPTRFLRVAGETDADGTPISFLEAKAFEVQHGHLNHFVTCPKRDFFRKKESANA